MAPILEAAYNRDLDRNISGRLIVIAVVVAVIAVVFILFGPFRNERFEIYHNKITDDVYVQMNCSEDKKEYHHSLHYYDCGKLRFNSLEEACEWVESVEKKSIQDQKIEKAWEKVSCVENKRQGAKDK